jgi:hypothetical protein
MRLVSSTLIGATPEAVSLFFANMPENYLRWHRDHVLFRWEGKGGLYAGARFYFEERIAGKLLRKRVRFTRIVPGRLIEFAVTNPLFRLVLPSIAFEIEPEGDGVRVTQTIRIRTGPIGAWLNRKEFAVVQKHMDEEGENLKRILEGGEAGIAPLPERE